MFKLTDKREIWWPVKIRVPESDGNTVKYSTHRVRVKFKLLGRQQLESIRTGDMEIDWPEIIVDWDGFADAEGNPLECTPENIEAVTDLVYVSRALMEAFVEAQAGGSIKN